ncbi:undecaprenyl-diphosphate phosphatase [Litoribrevibacter albus]|uniref:Undecaprenyl-diphosphatase n=1 Tax=Litoribrevibacter albus TaxID=1473156 RepID=A0AA37SAB1_9GAMM|nr:undecaprenyl-diphosphate phosphatase [Litoribrevibacter albus]GLQ31190.1 undecaprenyl-diphosphatase 1 [Litoribrevibacter albus]
MAWFQLVLLAVIQGLTEFLPISSSAHLILPAQLLGWQDQGLTFDVAVHVGTLLAVLIYFRKDVFKIAMAWFGSFVGKGVTTEAKMGWWIIIATIPVVLCGATLNDFIETHLRSIVVIAAASIFFGLVLLWADKAGSRKQPMELLGIKGALAVGLAQVFALIPGTSRSGVTMTASLFLGQTRESAARFSFLLSIPVILGAGLFKGKDLIEQGSDASMMVAGSGALLAAISAYICIKLFLAFINRIGVLPFVIYRCALGIILLGIAFIIPA